jgi:hypothetical protein
MVFSPLLRALPKSVKQAASLLMLSCVGFAAKVGEADE